MVGTRRASRPALGIAYGIGAQLSARGIVTVSGCAKGIDSAAQEGALSYSGSTIGVLGNGFGYNYLPEQVFFRRRIIKKGLLLTELSPFAGPTRYTFPKRNRIIAGLSSSVTVVESGKKGGSLITAEDCLGLGRPVFAPSDDIITSEGCSALVNSGAAAAIKDISPLVKAAGGGAGNRAADHKPLSFYRDSPPSALFPEEMTLEEFAFYSGTSPAEAEGVYERYYRRGAAVPDGQAAANRNTRPPEKAEKKERPPAGASLDGDMKTVFDAVDACSGNLDLIAEKTGLGANAVMKAVSRLELMGLLTAGPGNSVKK